MTLRRILGLICFIPLGFIAMQLFCKLLVALFEAFLSAPDAFFIVASAVLGIVGVILVADKKEKVE